jgi:CheY-like chemotaxis protein
MTATAICKAMRAMVVSGSRASRQVITEYLASWGIENVALSSGAEALDALKPASDADDKQIIILIDEQTCGMDPLHLAREIKNHFGAKPNKVIMFGAGSAMKDVTAAVDAWIAKPVRPSHLFSCLLKVSGNTERAGADTIAAAPPSPTGDEQPQWRKTTRVLLVDDNLVNRTMGAQQLSVLGYPAEIVDGARSGLEVVSSGRSDIVLMDCEMPEMDGYEAVAEIRLREGTARHTVVIALTAHATADDRGRCLDAGMDDYLAKPVKLRALAEMLDSWAQRGVPSVPTALAGRL